jgi:hypothetical protein
VVILSLLFGHATVAVSESVRLRFGVLFGVSGADSGLSLDRCALSLLQSECAPSRADHDALICLTHWHFAAPAPPVSVSSSLSWLNPNVLATSRTVDQTCQWSALGAGLVN